nr:hypothetical protein GCM10020092_080860 [Actinoplanes digitatis]
MAQTVEEKATAAATGASATERFQVDKTHASDTPPERVSMLARQVLEAVHATIREHQVTYAEYDALKAWLIQVGADGEWPLFLDVFVEHVVEEVANADREGSKGTIEGPFYVPDAPAFSAEATLPMRPDEKGTPMTFHGQVRAVDGTPLGGALVDIWHCDDDGFYAQFAPRNSTVESAGPGHRRRERQLHDPHHPAGAVPDPDRRGHWRDHPCRELARLAASPPTPEGVRGRPPADHHTAVLPGRPAQRRRHRRRGQGRTHARSEALR